jgi:Protein of unknown function with PCYCGC motif
MSDRMQRRRFLKHLKQMAMGLGTAGVGGSLVWWSLAPASQPLQRTPSGDLLESIAPGQLPSFARKGGSKVEEVYRYAVAHGDTLQYIPCFCGCEHVGHRSNADCYVAERHPDGRITFTNHGAM